MRLHRFNVGEELELKHDFWIHDEEIMRIWWDELHFQSGQDVLLVNESHERLYKIVEIRSDEAHLQYVTDFVRQPHAKDT